MKRVLTVIGRFFVRLWFLHRNQAIVKAHKLLEQALSKRGTLLSSVPENYREDIIAHDLILREAKETLRRLQSFFKEAGVDYEK